ncbi:glycosyltransferase [Dyadobacter sandarakinus]|uniref:Glycosyltransferase n=1 Tax=Dyadobacter sandarakinus TaxID=2747268 RepID=A0ABX7I8R3_9BACT|nr:glycosyltransferase [Dyadobacter sandarakinus]QRR01927.1 glycosyltransferase [Dyadobacter sandarakinus]
MPLKADPASASDTLAPVVLFCYNRPHHLQQTILSLRANYLAAETDLIIFSDGTRSQADEADVQKVRNFLATITGFKSIRVHAASQNLGLSGSVIQGVTDTLACHNAVIVLEDDMLTTPDFLEYMNQALSIYARRSNIFSVTAYAPPVAIPAGYPHDVYLAPRASSWGWATWADRWAKADWSVQAFEKLKTDRAFRTRFVEGGDDLWPMLAKQQKGIIDSWAIRWTYSQFINHALGLYPVRSKIRNIGTDGSGTNFTFKTGYYDADLNAGPVIMPTNLQPDSAVIREFRKYYRLPLYLKIKNRIKYGL